MRKQVIVAAACVVAAAGFLAAEVAAQADFERWPKGAHAVGRDGLPALTAGERGSCRVNR